MQSQRAWKKSRESLEKDKKKKDRPRPGREALFAYRQVLCDADVHE